MKVIILKCQPLEITVLVFNLQCLFSSLWFLLLFIGQIEEHVIYYFSCLLSEVLFQISSHPLPYPVTLSFFPFFLLNSMLSLLNVVYCKHFWIVEFVESLCHFVSLQKGFLTAPVTQSSRHIPQHPLVLSTEIIIILPVNPTAPFKASTLHFLCPSKCWHKVDIC